MTSFRWELRKSLRFQKALSLARTLRRGAQARVVQRQLGSPPALQAQTKYFLPSIDSPLTFALGIELSLPDLSDPVGL